MSRAADRDRFDVRGNGPAIGAALVLAGIVAGVFLPKLVKLGRVSAKTIAGVRFTSGVPGGGRANADPAVARPA